MGGPFGEGGDGGRLLPCGLRGLRVRLESVGKIKVV